MTTFDVLIALQIANNDDLLARHLKESPGNALYRSMISLIEAIDKWLI